MRQSPGKHEACATIAPDRVAHPTTPNSLAARPIALMIERVLLAAFALVVCAGCRAGTAKVTEARIAYRGGDFESAAKTLEKLSKQGGLHSVSRLELAMVDLARGRPEDAERELRKLRKPF